MRTLILIMMAGVIAGCASTPLEAIVTDQKLEGWKIGSQHDLGAGKGTIIELIPAGESIDRWKHLSTIQFLEGAHQTPRALMDALESSMMARCASGTHWKLIAEEPHSVTYEWGIHSCTAQDDQNELARILQGNDGLHRIAYTEKGETMNPENREFWMGVLKKHSWPRVT